MTGSGAEVAGSDAGGSAFTGAVGAADATGLGDSGRTAMYTIPDANTAPKIKASRILIFIMPIS